MGKIIIMMGASASGKDTIARTLIRENKHALKEIIMHTTRPQREGEQNGREYYFSTEEKMIELENQKRIIECRKYDTIHGPWYYFTPSIDIDLENNNYFATNTLVGLDQYLKYYTPDQIISILIQTEDGIRLTRALNRENKEMNPKYAEMCRRFLSDQEDFSRENIEKRSINAIIKNDSTIENALDKVNKVLSLHL